MAIINAGEHYVLTIYIFIGDNVAYFNIKQVQNALKWLIKDAINR